ncbi:BZ3500_MvSof-1268-A1-R1_Chr8-2g10133 [Microbotryum saponariae]|uniref:BZ3500_MvSof-1268-A1-R1_Chr8-2g10133 protein n=1 Tax=Microbotryum saponariae TaxID=289078 RepID=A0A2X0L9Y0_9BASI|nr:BZ3500_MvSof-1268-A1-R1_Chr8-2g10133 [Microbotryum saponariae]SDA01850.1 BZ3501_MvSof-1269-A2-R1_Chr8-2g09884 [Microbotryum saponariae]
MSFERKSNAEAQQSNDYSAVMRHCGHKGYQMFAVIAPPLFLLTSLRKRSFSPRIYLRNVGLTTFVGGTALGVAAGAGRMSGLDAEQINDRAVRILSNGSQTRVDDYGIIGGVLGALGTTTIFLKRAPMIWTVTGGAALGVAGGIIFHLAKSMQEGEHVKPEAMLEEAKEAVNKGVVDKN